MKKLLLSVLLLSAVALSSVCFAQEHQLQGFFANTPSSNPFFAPSLQIPAANIDWNAGNVQYKTLAANTTFTFSNSTDGQKLEVFLTNTSGNYTVTWPVAVKWPGGTAPTQTVGVHTDKYVFTNVNGTIYGSVTANY